MSATQRSARSSSAGTGEPGWAAIPIGVALTRPGARGDRGGEPVGGGRSDARPPSAAQPGTPRGPGPVAVRVDDQQPAHAELGEGVGDGGAGAARSEEHDPLAVGVREPVGERRAGSR